MNNVVEDVSVLTNIPKKNLDKILDIFALSIAESVYENSLDDIETSELDIGIGQLVVNYSNNEVKYRFRPSANLNKYLRDTLVNKLNSLEVRLEKAIVDKLVDTYEQII